MKKNHKFLTFFEKLDVMSKSWDVGGKQKQILKTIFLTLKAQ